MRTAYDAVDIQRNKFRFSLAGKLEKFLSNCRCPVYISFNGVEFFNGVGLFTVTFQSGFECLDAQRGICQWIIDLMRYAGCKLSKRGKLFSLDEESCLLFYFPSGFDVENIQCFDDEV